MRRLTAETLAAICEEADAWHAAHSDEEALAAWRQALETVVYAMSGERRLPLLDAAMGAEPDLRLFVLSIGMALVTLAEFAGRGKEPAQ